MITQIDLENFKNWLVENGCEIIPPKTSHQLLIFHSSRKYKRGVIYNQDYLRISKNTQHALNCFYEGKNWIKEKVKKQPKDLIKRQGTSAKNKKKIKLLVRDGFQCFYCGCKLNEDITIEHLIALSNGGQDEISNMVLTHKKCNEKAGHKSISEKVKIALRNRSIKDFSINSNY